MKRLEGRVALVTGGARGIGAAVVRELAENGAKVYINYAASGEGAKRLKEELEQKGFKAETVPCDVSDRAAVKEMIDNIFKEEGSLDILVNNAGITKDNILLRMKPEEFDQVIAINLTGSFNCMQAAAKYMLKKRYGRIINISSVSGLMGNPGQANYAASKAGVIGMTKTAARELASRSITVNAIAPGFIKSDMTDALPQEARDSLLGMIPLGSFGEPEDIAAMVNFLAGEEGRYITGQVLCVDGGMAM